MKIKLPCRIYKSPYGWERKQAQCPVCHGWRSMSAIKIHIMKSASEEHRQFVEKHSIVVTRKTLNVDFEDVKK